MTSTWKPTPGRDAMTRDGRRATEIKRSSAEPDDCVLSGLVDGVRHIWVENGYYFADKWPAPLDLVADADPLPATGPVRERTIREIVEGVYGRLRIEGYDPEEGLSVRLVDRNGGGKHGLTHYLTASEVDAVIATLTAIRDAMEDKP